MKTVLLYSSSRGTTSRLVTRMKSRTNFEYDIFDVCDVPDAQLLAGYDYFLILTPTYGDSEPQVDMEDFMLRFSLDMRGKQIAVVSLGTYEGYEFLTFVGGQIVRDTLVERGAVEFMSMVGIDCLPGVDLVTFDAWVDALNAKMEALCLITT